MRIFDEQDDVDESGQPEGKERQDMSDHELSVEYQYGENRFKASGNAQDVNMHAAAFLSSLSYAHPQSRQKLLPSKGDTGQLPLFTQNDPSSSANDNGSTEVVNGAIADQQPLNFVTSYLEYNTKGQQDQLLVVTHLAKKVDGHQKLSLSDYRHYYDMLADIPVKEPVNISARLGEAVEKGHLRRQDDGSHSLTITGQQVVEAMHKK